MQNIEINSLFLIRVDDLEYLKSLQEGSVFMRNNLYYQCGDKSDSARTDIIDGSIPTFDNVRIKVPKGIYVSDARIMHPDYYIKCFTQCYADDLQIFEDRVQFSLKQSVKNELLKMKKEYAIVILTLPFTDRFYSACIKQEVPYGAYSVQYLDDAEMKEQSTEYLNAIIDVSRGIHNHNKLLNPIFFKPSKFAFQQEYRIFAQFKDDITSQKEVLLTSQMDVLKNATHLISIDGGIKDISTIVNLNDLLESRVEIILND